MKWIVLAFFATFLWWLAMFAFTVSLTNAEPQPLQATFVVRLVSLTKSGFQPLECGEVILENYLGNQTFLNARQEKFVFEEGAVRPVVREGVYKISFACSDGSYQQLNDGSLVDVTAERVTLKPNSSHFLLNAGAILVIMTPTAGEAYP